MAGPLIMGFVHFGFWVSDMPTLTRLVLVVLVIFIVVFGAIIGLATLVKPVTAELIVDIPSSRVQPRDWPDTEKNRFSESSEPNLHNPVTERLSP